MKNTMRIVVSVIVIAIGIIIAAPIIIGLGVSADILNNFTNNNDWIGFWGSYVGTIIGGIITLAVLYFTLKNENYNKKREEKIQYFDKLIDEWASVDASLANLCFYVNKYLNKQDENVFERIILYNNEIVKLGTSFILKIEIRVDQYDMFKLKEEYEKLIDFANSMMEYFSKEIINGDDIKKIEYIMDCMEERAKIICACLNKTIQENLD